MKKYKTKQAACFSHLKKETQKQLPNLKRFLFHTQCVRSASHRYDLCDITAESDAGRSFSNKQERVALVFVLIYMSEQVSGPDK